MRILIGTPTFDRRLDIDMVRTILWLEREQKHNFDYVFPVSSHIARNRNLIVHQALKENHDAVLFWDSDIGIEDKDFIKKMIETGYNLNAKIVGGAYMMKKPNEVIYVAGHKKEDGRYDNIREKPEKPILCEAVGTGIMLVWRDVFLKLEDPWFSIIDKPLLDVMPEDFFFCEKAKQVGFNIALDPTFNTHHYGHSAYSHIWK